VLKFIKSVWHRFTRKADESVVSALAEESWKVFRERNKTKPTGGHQYLYGAHLNMTKKFVRRYYRKHGLYPVGWHAVFSDRMTLFTPTPSSPLVLDADSEAHA
jgi:hypothetical protein